MQNYTKKCVGCPKEKKWLLDTDHQPNGERVTRSNKSNMNKLNLFLPAARTIISKQQINNSDEILHIPS